MALSLCAVLISNQIYNEHSPVLSVIETDSVVY